MDVTCDVLSPLWRVFAFFLRVQKESARHGMSGMLSGDEGSSIGNGGGRRNAAPTRTKERRTTEAASPTNACNGWALRHEGYVIRRERVI